MELRERHMDQDWASSLYPQGVPLASGMCGNSHICVDSLVELHLF